MSIADPSRLPGSPPTPLQPAPPVAMAATLDASITPPDSADRVQVAQRLGRFVLLRELGSGGMGTVFAAYDEQLDRKVALKLLHTAVTDSDERRRVLREAQAMARVSHPNVVQVYDVGEIHGRVFIAMEYIEGGTLSAWQKTAQSWQATLRLYHQAGSGLLAAHCTGLVHRDFKPDNVFPVEKIGQTFPLPSERSGER